MVVRTVRLGTCRPLLLDTRLLASTIDSSLAFTNCFLRNGTTSLLRTYPNTVAEGKTTYDDDEDESGYPSAYTAPQKEFKRLNRWQI